MAELNQKKKNQTNIKHLQNNSNQYGTPQLSRIFRSTSNRARGARTRNSKLK